MATGSIVVAGGAGSVGGAGGPVDYVYNCANLVLTSFVVDSTDYAPKEGAPALSGAVISPPFAVPIGKGSFSTSGQVEVSAYFNGVLAWRQSIRLSVSFDGHYLWGYLNGYLVSAS